MNQTSPSSRENNVIGNIDFRTITALRNSIRWGKANWSQDYRFQKGIEKEEDLLDYFMRQIHCG